jgi:hypothetical protein
MATSFNSSNFSNKITDSCDLRRKNINKEKVTMRLFRTAVFIIIALICAGKPSLGADQRTEACTILTQYMAEYYKLYQASGHKTNPQAPASLRAAVEHKLMDFGLQAEVFVALARYEFACRACFYLGWDSECAQIPHYTKTVVDLAGCVE